MLKQKVLEHRKFADTRNKMPDCSPKTDTEKEPKAEDDGIEDEVEEEKAPKAKGHDSGSADLEKVTDYAEDKEILSTGKDLEDALQAIRNKQAQKTAEKVARERELAKVVIAKEDVELIVQV